MVDNHNDLYALVRDDFEPVRLRAGLDDIVARGRAVRRRRRSGLVASLAAVAAISGVMLTLSTGAKTHQPAPMSLAAWSVESAPDGTVVLTIRQLTDADRLTTALKAAGVPALVEFEQMPPEADAVGCAGNDQPSLPQLSDVTPDTAGSSQGGERAFTIRRDNMPSGTSLHFVLFEDHAPDGTVQHTVRTSLVMGTPLPCKPSWSSSK